MSVQVLIDSIVRQVTVLIAQRARGARGEPRKVSADMFGMALRAYVADCAAVPVATPCVGGCDAVVASSAAAALAAEVERIGLAICEKSCDPALVVCPPASVRCQQGLCTGE